MYTSNSVTVPYFENTSFYMSSENQKAGNILLTFPEHVQSNLKYFTSISLHHPSRKTSDVDHSIPILLNSIFWFWGSHSAVMRA